MNLAKLAEFERVKLSRNEMEFRDVSSSMKRPAIESSMSFAAGIAPVDSVGLYFSQTPAVLALAYYPANLDYLTLGECFVFNHLPSSLLKLSQTFPHSPLSLQ